MLRYNSTRQEHWLLAVYTTHLVPKKVSEVLEHLHGPAMPQKVLLQTAQRQPFEHLQVKKGRNPPEEDTKQVSSIYVLQDGVGKGGVGQFSDGITASTCCQAEARDLAISRVSALITLYQNGCHKRYVIIA
eukprot:2842741-Amphidinium_carterae.1